MSEEERKMMAYIAGMLYKLSVGEQLNSNEIQSLQNIMDDLEFYEIGEDHFRW